MKKIIQKIKSIFRTAVKIAMMVSHPNEYTKKERLTATLEFYGAVYNSFQKMVEARDDIISAKDDIIRNLVEISDINRNVSNRLTEEKEELMTRIDLLSRNLDSLYATATECVDKKNYKALKKWIEDFENITFADDEFEDIFKESDTE